MAAHSSVEIAPSILAADFSALGEAVRAVEHAGAKLIHVDVMDGHFVPNITIGPAVVKAIRPHTTLPLDVHLMIDSPEKYIKQFADAGADFIVVHVEACTNIEGIVRSIKDLGVKAGVTLKPATPVETIEKVLPLLDIVLVMTVEPGFGGQAFMESCLDKIVKLRNMLDKKNLKAELEVDGGINTTTAPRVVKAGARVLVAGAAVFNKNQIVKEAIQKLRASLG